MGKEIVTQAEEAEIPSRKDKPKRDHTDCTVSKLTKVKDKVIILKATREKTTNNIQVYQLIFSAETPQKVKRECQGIFKVMKGKNLQTRRLLFSFDGEIKSFISK